MPHDSIVGDEGIVSETKDRPQGTSARRGYNNGVSANQMAKTEAGDQV